MVDPSGEDPAVWVQYPPPAPNPWLEPKHLCTAKEFPKLNGMSVNDHQKCC